MIITTKDKWRYAQAGELDWHIRNQWRANDEAFRENNEKVFAEFSKIIPPRSFKNKEILDVGAGPRLRTKYFPLAKIHAIEPLGERYINEFAWCDLNDSVLYSVPIEEYIPSLREKFPFIFSINVLDHCLDFQQAMWNISKYLGEAGGIYLSYDYHDGSDPMHPLKLDEEESIKVFESVGLYVVSFWKGDTYGNGEYSLNFFLGKAKQKTLKEIHSFWKNPDKINLPSTYISGKRSDFLLDLFSKVEINKEDSILELGCNVGRNLNKLYTEGYLNLSGVELNTNAKPLMLKSFPEVSRSANIYWNSIESTIKSIPKHDIIFTMAVLEHIHPDSEWIFRYIALKTHKFLITIEDEHIKSFRHFVRNYKEVFESLGLVQVYELNCFYIPELGGDFLARIFIKDDFNYNNKL